MVHSLTDVDIDNRQATCKVCGPVDIRSQGAQRWRCRNKLNDLKRAQKYRKKYGIDIGTVDVSVCCELCGGTTRIAYDHDHQTGEFRGWLCMKCNTALGLVNDDIVLLSKMIIYLQKQK